MSVDSAVSWLTWLVAGLAAAALVLLVLIRRWAGRLLVLGVAALLAVGLFAARHQIAAIPTDSPEPLCNNGITWFGVHLTGSEQLCVRYRTSG